MFRKLELDTIFDGIYPFFDEIISSSDFLIKVHSCRPNISANRRIYSSQLSQYPLLLDRNRLSVWLSMVEHSILTESEKTNKKKHDKLLYRKPKDWSKSIYLRETNHNENKSACFWITIHTRNRLYSFQTFVRDSCKRIDKQTTQITKTWRTNWKRHTNLDSRKVIFSIIKT